MPPTSSKIAAYTTGWGLPVFKQIGVAGLRSLRKTGYAGDLYLITDGIIPEIEADLVQYGIQPVIITLPTADSPNIIKASLHHHIDLSRYDRVFFTDGDVHWLKDPIEYLSSLEFGPDCDFYVTQDSPPLLKDFLYNAAYFNFHERKQITDSTISINSGLILFNPKTMEDICKAWESRWLSRPHNYKVRITEWLEQPALQYIFTYQIIKAKLFDGSLVGYPMLERRGVSHYADRYAVHLCGGDRTEDPKIKILGAMEALGRGEDIDTSLFVDKSSKNRLVSESIKKHSKTFKDWKTGTLKRAKLFRKGLGNRQAQARPVRFVSRKVG